MRFALLIILAIIITACSSTRQFGDADGNPVEFSVRVERAFFDSMGGRSWQPSAGAGVGFSSGGRTGLGLGVGLGFTSTSIYLIAGDEPGQARLFRKQVRWGENTFTVPLRPGRRFIVGVQAEGGRQGWESLGSVIIPLDGTPQVRVVLDASGGMVTQVP